MSRKLVSVERFENEKWIETSIRPSTLPIDNLSYRVTYRSSFYSIKTEVIYYLNGNVHRLDAPAYERYQFEMVHQEWYVHNRYIIDFQCYLKNKYDIFRYIKDYPSFIKEVEILAKHNSWLNEEEFLLLSTIALTS